MGFITTYNLGTPMVEHYTPNVLHEKLNDL